MWCSWASRSRNSWYTSSTTSLMRASGRSTLLITRTTGRWLSRALRSTKRVCGSGPSLASTSRSTPSTIASPRSTSPPKSAWPGVSTMLIFTSPYWTATFLARMVMPFSRSRSPESRTRSATSWFSRKAPDCQSMASTRVVFPWSTWATMATLRRSDRTGIRTAQSREPRGLPKPVLLGVLPDATGRTRERGRFAFQSDPADADNAQMRERGRARSSVVRLFGVHAAISLIPVLVLGAALALNFKSEAQRRGLNEGESQAALVAETGVEPLFPEGHLLTPALTQTQREGLSRLASNKIILRLRLRDLTGQVVWSADESGMNATLEDEAVEAATGEPVAVLTHVNADANDEGPTGVQAVEVYRALEAGDP